MQSIAELRVIPVDTKTPVSLAELAAGKPFVLDLWKSQCPKCPAAVANLAAKANKRNDILFLAVNIDDMEHAELMADDSQLESLTHTHMDFDTKEQLKAMLGFSKVPYCVMASADGVVQHHGLAHGIDYNLLDTLAAVPAATAAESTAAAPANQELVFDEDF